MLQTRPNGTSLPVKTHGFLVAVEIEEGQSAEVVSRKLMDALTWVEGIGQADVDHLGEIEEIEPTAKEES